MNTASGNPHGFRYGKHGLPLIGTGDWNDGMNLVGEHGKGESNCWVFLYDVLMCLYGYSQDACEKAFAALCVDEANRCEAH